MNDNSLRELTVLDRTGDVTITWDDADGASKEKARAEIAALKTAGYLFFLLDGTAADEVAAGKGALVARIVTAEELLALEPETEPEAASEDQAQPKRGRPKKERAIAVPAVRGG